MKTVLLLPSQERENPGSREFWQQFLDRRYEALRPHRVDVPKSWHVAPQYYCPRDCFPRALQFLRLRPKLPQALYVFGEASCGGFQQHA
jgi:hypothetical protein